MANSKILSFSDLLAKAKTAQARGDWEAAEDLLNQILKKAQSHPEANYLLGCMALEAGYPEDALSMVARALKREPTNQTYQRLLTLSLTQLIKTHAKKHRWVDVSAYALQLSRQHGPSGEALGWLATAWMKLGQSPPPRLSSWPWVLAFSLCKEGNAAG